MTEIVTGHCREPGCGIEFAYLPGLSDSLERCWACSQRLKRERLAADAEARRNGGSAGGSSKGDTH